MGGLEHEGHVTGMESSRIFPVSGLLSEGTQGAVGGQ